MTRFEPEKRRQYGWFLHTTRWGILVFTSNRYKKCHQRSISYIKNQIFWIKVKFKSDECVVSQRRSIVLCMMGKAPNESDNYLIYISKLNFVPIWLKKIRSTWLIFIWQWMGPSRYPCAQDQISIKTCHKKVSFRGQKFEWRSNLGHTT